jgi:hypothetical protein
MKCPVTLKELNENDNQQVAWFSCGHYCNAELFDGEEFRDCGIRKQLMNRTLKCFVAGCKSSNGFIYRLKEKPLTLTRVGSLNEVGDNDEIEIVETSMSQQQASLLIDDEPSENENIKNKPVKSTRPIDWEAKWDAMDERHRKERIAREQAYEQEKRFI